MEQESQKWNKENSRNGTRGSKMEQRKWWKWKMKRESGIRIMSKLTLEEILMK